jgi:hypothetical protein
MNKHTSLYTMGLLTYIYGFLVALQYSAMNSLAYANIHTEDLSAATSIMGTIQQLTQSFGVAVCAILIRFFSYLYTTQSVSLRIFHITFIVMGGITLSSSLIFLRLRQDDGHEMIRIQ